MSELLIATIMSRDVSAVEALTNQFGRWKIKGKAELIFVAADLDENNLKVVITFQKGVKVKEFIKEFERDDRLWSNKVQFSEMKLVEETSAKL